MTELTPRDDDKKRVSEILKRVDQLIKTNEYEQAVRETERAKEIDPRNVYIDAYQERLGVLIEQARKNRELEEVRRKAAEEERKRQEEERQKRDEIRRKEEAERLRRLEEERKRQEEERKKEEERRKQEDEQRRRETAVKPAKGARVPAKVFLIDDDEKLLNIVKETIEDEGFIVSAFSTSDDAYKALKTETPDLILSDINLETSTMGGFSFYEKVRELDHLEEVPFIFLSGLSDEVLVRTGKEMGIDDYITKPFSEQSLIATIKGKIKRYRQIKSKRKST